MLRSSSFSYPILEKVSGWNSLIRLSASANSNNYGQSIVPSILLILFMLKLRYCRLVNFCERRVKSPYSMTSNLSFLISILFLKFSGSICKSNASVNLVSTLTFMVELIYTLEFVSL